MVDRIVILSDRSLLMDGLISQLQRYRSTFDLRIIDVLSENILELVMKVEPSVLILDGSNPVIAQTKLLMELIIGIPALRIINLDARSSQVKVIHWDSKQVSCINDLVSIDDCEICNPIIDSPQLSTTTNKTAARNIT